MPHQHLCKPFLSHSEHHIPCLNRFLPPLILSQRTHSRTVQVYFQSLPNHPNTPDLSPQSLGPVYHRQHNSPHRDRQTLRRTLPRSILLSQNARPPSPVQIHEAPSSCLSGLNDPLLILTTSCSERRSLTRCPTSSRPGASIRRIWGHQNPPQRRGEERSSHSTNDPGRAPALRCDDIYEYPSRDRSYTPHRECVPHFLEVFGMLTRILRGRYHHRFVAVSTCKGQRCISSQIFVTLYFLVDHHFSGSSGSHFG